MKNHLHRFFFGGFVFFLLSFSFCNKTYAQYFIFGGDNTIVEAGLDFGPTFFLGDLGGNHGYGSTFIKDVNLPLTKLQKGAFLTVYPNDWFGLRFAAEETYVEGNDDEIKTDGINELYRKQRNLDFKSNISEAYVAAEIYPFMLFKNSDDDYQPKLRPYGFIGAGVFHFNPMGSLTENGVTTWYYLRPLHTEGEGFPEYPNRKEYALTQANIPMGGGLKYFISDNLNISMEILYRKTFTDYIDDVSTTYIDPSLFFKYLPLQDAIIASEIYNKPPTVAGYSRFSPGEQRGDSTNNDTYFSVLLKVGIRLGTGEDKYSRRALSKTKCPARF